MGQYLQMGICYRLEVDKKRLDKLEVTLERLINELNKHLDITLYEINETHKEVIFEIKESVVLELQGFMQSQYSMYSQEEPYIDCFKSAVETIGSLSSFQEIVQVAGEGNFPCFQSNIITDEIKISTWNWLEIEISMFVFFVEGKILMEGYHSFLRYIENNVRESSKEWEIAGAFRCFIE